MEKSSLITILTMLLTMRIFTVTPVITRPYLEKRALYDTICNKIIRFNDFNSYAFEERKNISGIPADMSMHWKTGKLYFTLISDEMKMSLQTLLPSGEIEQLRVAGLGQSTAVDNLNDIVYLATDNGVYKYLDDGSIELYTALGKDVMYIAVNNDGNTMYLATWPQNRVHKITEEGQKMESFPVIPNGHGLTIDTRNNIFFVATKTSYVLKSGHRIPIKIKGLPSDKMTGIFVSRSNGVYAVDENSDLFIIDPDNTSAKYLGNFNVRDVNAFAMDASDNILIGIRGAILKYRSYEKSLCEK